MKRIPYSFVVTEYLYLSEQMILVPDWETLFYNQQYLIFLKVCGWTEEELLKELFKQIDMNW